MSDDASYLITSEWSDEAAFKTFIGSEAFRAGTTRGKEQILSGRPQHKIYKHQGAGIEYGPQFNRSGCVSA